MVNIIYLFIVKVSNFHLKAFDILRVKRTVTENNLCFSDLFPIATHCRGSVLQFV